MILLSLFDLAISLHNELHALVLKLHFAIAWYGNESKRKKTLNLNLLNST